MKGENWSTYMLKNFIIRNPPKEINGFCNDLWDEDEWRVRLDDYLPEWGLLLKNSDTWKIIERVRPRRDWQSLLRLLLNYATPETLADYLMKENLMEKKIATEVVLSNCGQLFNYELWELINNNCKLYMINSVIDHIINNTSEIIFERSMSNNLIHECKISPSFKHPLWIKLKDNIEFCEDFFSYKKITEIESGKTNKAYHDSVIISRNVMLDPSMFISKESLDNTMKFVRENYDEFSFYVSNCFKKLLENSEQDEWEKFVEFFVDDKSLSINSKNKIIESFNAIEGLKLCCSEKNHYIDKYSSLYEKLDKIEGSKIFKDIIFEEWIFVQEYSWLLSNSKRVMEIFKRIGVASFEIGEESFEKICRIILRKESDELVTTVEKFKTFGLLVAAGCNVLSIFLKELDNYCKGYGAILLVYLGGFNRL